MGQGMEHSTQRINIMNLITEFSGQQNVLTIPRIFIEHTRGSLAAALFLSRVLYWSMQCKDGWFYKSYAEWEKDISLSEYQVRQARNMLEIDGLIETQRRRVNGDPILWYRLNEGAVLELVSLGQ